MQNLLNISIFLIFNFFISFGTAQLAYSPGPDPGPEEEAYDSEGWLVIFDGTQAALEKRWWINGNTNTGNGGKWEIVMDADLGKNVLLSNQLAGGEGGLLFTNRKYKNVEVAVRFLPGWRNDGGLFFRANAKGAAWQIMYDFQPGNTIGGVYGESISGVSTQRMYRFDTKSTISKTGVTWSEPWSEVWTVDGYNTIVSSAVGRPPVLSSYIKNPKFIVTDFKGSSKASNLADDGYIGLQLHAGTSNWQGGPNFYEWVKVRELDANGQPLYKANPTPVIRAQKLKSDDFKLTWKKTTNHSLQFKGRISHDYTLDVVTITGKRLLKLTGKKGLIKFEVANRAAGFLFLRVQSEKGAHIYKISSLNSP